MCASHRWRHTAPQCQQCSSYDQCATFDQCAIFYQLLFLISVPLNHCSVPLLISDIVHSTLMTQFKNAGIFNHTTLKF